MNQSYSHHEPTTTVEFMEAEEVHTVVRKATDHPMSDMASVFDSTFEALFPELDAVGIRPAGPGYALHYRAPTDTATFDVGIPVDRPLTGARSAESGVIVEPSTIPGGRIARISYIGPYDGLPEAWEGFVDAITSAGLELTFPTWEMYVTEPTPDTDPSTLRTDLYALVTG